MENTIVADNLTRAEAAAFLRIPEATLAFYAVRRKGPRFYKIGKRCVYRRSDLESYLASAPAGGAPVAVEV
jgi:hypothetical protein